MFLILLIKNIHRGFICRTLLRYYACVIQSPPCEGNNEIRALDEQVIISVTHHSPQLLSKAADETDYINTTIPTVFYVELSSLWQIFTHHHVLLLPYKKTELVKQQFCSGLKPCQQPLKGAVLIKSHYMKELEGMNKLLMFKSQCFVHLVKQHLRFCCGKQNPTHFRSVESCSSPKCCTDRSTIAG